ncbi:hypothetical protein KAR91_61675 [Candidatus Pacearchaeota archaeon]|nr:hypothetical protein [Candidatus Pacearchaeota archaeon]
MEIDIQAIIVLLAFFGIGIGTSYAVFKAKLHQIRTFLDTVDDAVYDDDITEEEFRRSFEAFKKLVGK